MRVIPAVGDLRMKFHPGFYALSRMINSKGFGQENQQMLTNWAIMAIMA